MDYPSKQLILLNDIETLKRRIEEIEAIVKYGESPFKALSYLRTDIKDIMSKIMKKEY